MTNVPDNIREAIAELVAYSWPDEERDYKEMLDMGEGVNGHIYQTIVRIDAWLNNLETKR